MKKAMLTLLLSAAAAPTMAQSSVTLYGLVSEGLTWVNNEGGAHNYKLLSGSQQNNRLGFKITEDLGGGTRALAQLENGFDSTNGKLGQGGRMFGRQAFVGLSNTSFGTITAGRQYDMFWDYIAAFSPSVVASSVLAVPGDADDVMGSWRYNNSVKYVSPTLRGFDFEAMYAFSNAAGDFALNRAYSAGAHYANGPFQIAVAYTQLDSPGMPNAAGAVTDDYVGAPFFLFRTSPLDSNVGVDRQRNYGVGARYDIASNLRVSAVVEANRYDYRDGISLALDNYEVSASWLPTPVLAFGAGYIYTSGRYHGVAANPHWNGVSLSADYSLSKRTDVYVYDVFQRVSGPHAVADVYLNAPSTSSDQNMLVAGIRHRF